MIKFFPDMKTFVQIAGVDITMYAVLIVGGAYLAYYLSARVIKKAGYSEDELDGLFIGALAFGIIGARLWFVLFYDLKAYIADPISIFMVRDGGLAIHGGLFLGVLYGWWYTRRKGINFWQWADVIIPNVLIAQAAGRWGNFFNQEAFGGVVSESFFRYFPAFIKDNMFINGAYHEPTFLYESVLNLLGWFLIIRFVRRSKNLKRGDQVFAYMLWYGASRFVIEGMRTDSLFAGNFRIAQVVSVVFVVVGLIGFYGGFKKLIKRNKPALLFDFDGTVMDTQALILETFRRVFKNRKPDMEMTDEILYSFLGPTLYDSFGRFFPEEEVEDVVQEYRVLNIELHEEFVKPMDHVVEVLTDLKEKGYQMGIVSSKLKDPIDFALKMTKMDHLFEFVYGLEEYDKAKPDPDGILKALKDFGYDRSQVIYFGDTPSDIVAGRRAGSFTVGYLFDEKREQELRASQPNRVISDWNELDAILKEDHEWTYNTI